MVLIPSHDHVTYPSLPETVANIDSYLDTKLKKAGFPEYLLADVAVSVSEVVSNAVIHGNREDATKNVQVEVEIKADRVSISVQDEGEGFDPDSLPDPVSQDNLMREVGRGLFIVRAYMDEVYFKKIDGGGLRITLVKVLPDAQN